MPEVAATQHSGLLVNDPERANLPPQILADTPHNSGSGIVKRIRPGENLCYGILRRQ